MFASKFPATVVVRLELNGPAVPAVPRYSDAVQNESLADSPGHCEWHRSSGLWP